MKLGYAEILELVSKAKTTTDKVKLLREHGSEGLCSIINLAFDKRVVWLLPEGTPPYKPNPYPDQQNQLQGELRKLNLFLEMYGIQMNATKRESLFIGFLETIDPEDAKLILAVKEKRLPYKGLPKSLFEEAWTGRIVADQ